MVINRFGNHTGEETHDLRETSRFTNNNNNNNNNIIIYIGLFSFSFIELFNSSFIAFQLCTGDDLVIFTASPWATYELSVRYRLAR